MAFWAERKVLVAGGAGFLGAHVVRNIRDQGCQAVIVPRSREFDLREEASIIRLFEQARPDLVLHLAATVGGIGANRRHPGQFFYDNAIMGLQLMEQARRSRLWPFGNGSLADQARVGRCCVEIRCSLVGR
jgi:GDP-L-fucose synthase